ncbi:hypothetical protein [Polynucleobacter sphagniphilus]|jgi:hypothetical protein|uniref:O-antigen polymerase n=1 Tax=Polynucleobacter sphagniphilus TaxID=1743169 RepID=A0AA43MBJ0_9BURK|nr:hypothetical protein [Polynucleobacter sphagniphilus]MDH6504723.1 hypothetical protein [Polynucleobacter sphagniphilus]MDH6513457.1 hypothetical protein [Polynucleobacter sphagniphilus]
MYLSASTIPKPASQAAYWAVIGLIPFTLGFGVYPLLIPVLIAALLGLMLIGIKPFLTNIQDCLPSRGCLVLLGGLGLFLVCYRGLYIPYHPEALKMPWGFFPILFALSIFTVLWIAFFTKPSEHIRFIWCFCLGALVLGLATVSATLALQAPPYYGNVIDIRYLPFGMVKFINTPGMANLLSLFPATFLAGFLLKPNQRPKWFWPLGVVGFTLSLGAGVALGQRSFFIVALVIEPIVVALFLLLLKSWRSFIVICSLLMSYPILRWADQAAGTGFLYRPLDQHFFNDGRFQMLRYWLEHFIANPFQRTEVGPAQWAGLQWFHNFFADVHRLSGFWALLAVVILIAYIFYRIFCVVRIDKRFGLFLMAIAIPCFLIMNTSVVPEGERQPFLLLLAIGAISEVAILRERNRLKANATKTAIE